MPRSPRHGDGIMAVAAIPADLQEKVAPSGFRRVPGQRPMRDVAAERHGGKGREHSAGRLPAAADPPGTDRP